MNVVHGALRSAPVASKGQPFLEIKNVAKTYVSVRGDVPALSDINLTIGACEFISILGPSGCGKTTLLRCLAGLEQPSAGVISIGSNVVSGPPDNLGWYSSATFCWSGAPSCRTYCCR